MLSPIKKTQYIRCEFPSSYITVPILDPYLAPDLQIPVMGYDVVKEMTVITARQKFRSALENSENAFGPASTSPTLVKSLKPRHKL